MKLTKQQRQQLKDKYGGKCAYCGCDLADRWCTNPIKTKEVVKKSVKVLIGNNIFGSYAKESNL